MQLMFHLIYDENKDFFVIIQVFDNYHWDFWSFSSKEAYIWQ